MREEQGKSREKSTYVNGVFKLVQFLFKGKRGKETAK